MNKYFKIRIPVILIILLFISSCTSYKSQEVAFRSPAAYTNTQNVSGASIAAEAFADPDRAKEAFGYNIRKAGLLPVQVVIDNKGSHSLQVVTNQTFLVDDQGGMWNALDNNTAYKRVENSSEFAGIGKKAGRGALLGTAGGALLGAAVGVVTGHNVGETTLKGAAAGAAGGAVAGGASEMSNNETGQQISQDLANKELQNKSVQPGSLIRGFIFFPGEATSAKQLRLQVQEVDTGEIHTMELYL